MAGILAGLLSVLFVVTAVVLVLIVLVQRSQGGGLSGAFGSAMGGSQTAFGAKTGDVLTWVTVGAFTLFLLTAVGQVLSVDARLMPQMTAPPEPPGKVTATAKSASVVTITWEDNSDNEDQFVIQRSIDGGQSWVEGPLTPGNTTTVDDGNLLAETEYLYRVIAFSQETGASEPSESVKVKTLTPETSAGENTTTSGGDQPSPDTQPPTGADEPVTQPENGGENGENGGG